MAWSTPATAVAGTALTASTWNATVRDNLKAIGDSWTAYTPALTGWTLVNGTLTGRAVQAGKWVSGSIVYTVGSSDTKSGAPVFSLPVASAAGAVGPAIGTAGLQDTSAGARAFRFVFNVGTSTIQCTTDADVRLSPTVPWTWATGDVFYISFSYEAA